MHFLMVYFDEQKFLKFWNQISLFFLWLVFSEKSLPNPRSQKISYIFFSKLIVLYLHFILCHIWIIDLCLLGSTGRGSLSPHYSYPASLVKRRSFHQRIWLGASVRDQVTIYVWLYFCALICFSVIKWIPHCIDYWSFILIMEIRLGKLSSIFPLFQITLAVIGSLHLDTNFRITCPFIKKRFLGS